MNINSIIAKLKGDNKPFKQIRNYCDEPGVYAVFFHTKNFPLSDYEPKRGEVIYIGKTESSQISRDINTHFASGRTGSSTLRRTFGSLLRKQLHLKPIPRNDKDFAARRFTKFKFDLRSEDKLTDWMQNNLGLSFYAYPASTIEIDRLETELIQELQPVLNIAKNPANPFAWILKEERRATGSEAFKVDTNIKAVVIQKPSKQSLEYQPEKQIGKIGGSNQNKYVHLWNQFLPKILMAIVEVNMGNDLFSYQCKFSRMLVIGKATHLIYN